MSAPTPNTLYHLTTLAALRKIMRSNRLHTGAFRAVSFTEDPSLFGQDFQYGNDFGSSTVRIVVDGVRLSRDYPVEPHVDGQSERFIREKEWRVPGQSVEGLSRYVRCVEVLSRRPHDETDHYWKRVGLGWDPKRKVDLRQKVLDEVVSLGESTGFRVVVTPSPSGRGCATADRTAYGDAAPQRRALIRLASTLPVGSDDRRTILAGLVREAGMDRVALRIRELRSLLDAGRQFGVLSAYGPVPKSVNKDRNVELMRTLDARGYRPHPLRGSWNGVAEKSVLVPGMAFADLVELGRRFDQESVIYKDPSGVIGMYFLREGTVTFAVDEEGSMAVQMATGRDLYSKSRGISFEFGFAWGVKHPWNGTTPYTVRGLSRALAGA